MYVQRLAWFLGVVILFASTACSNTPTSPSRVAPAPTVAVISQEPPPVPPRITVGPPNALGATRYLAFGDSITYGYGSSNDGAFVFDHSGHSYPVRLLSALTTYHSMPCSGCPAQSFLVFNDGRPGEWAADGASRIQASINSYRPHALLLLEGINDLASEENPATAAASLARIIDTARLNNVVVLVATMFQTYPVTVNGVERDNAAGLVVEYNNEIRRLVMDRRNQNQNVYLVDLYAAFGTSNGPLMSGDGLHPSDTGYELMASTFHAVIEAVFPVRGSFQ